MLSDHKTCENCKGWAALSDAKRHELQSMYDIFLTGAAGLCETQGERGEKGVMTSSSYTCRQFNPIFTWRLIEYDIVRPADYDDRFVDCTSSTVKYFYGSHPPGRKIRVSPTQVVQISPGGFLIWLPQENSSTKGDE